jgi:hypothetical protein
MCEECGIFPSFVGDVRGKELCYPCYFFRVLGNYEDAHYWLDFRSISGEEEAVKKWIDWNAANRQDNSVQEPVG